MFTMWAFIVSHCVTKQVDWAKQHLEKQVTVKDVFDQFEIIDTIGITHQRAWIQRFVQCL